MSVKHIQKNRMNSEKTYDVIHYETDSDVVLMSDGEETLTEFEEVMRALYGDALRVVLFTKATDDMNDVLNTPNHVGLYKTGLDTLNTPFSEEATSFSRALILSYTRADGDYGFQIAFPAGANTPFMRRKSSSGITSWTTGYLPLRGGSIASTSFRPLTVNRESDGSVGIEFGHYESSESTTMATLGAIGFSSNGALAASYGEDTTLYRILTRRDKPSASYTGDGSTATRTIDTAGFGNLLVVYNSTHGMILVGPGGAICKASSTVSGLARSAASYSDGVLTLKTDSSFLNEAGATYQYYVI